MFESPSSSISTVFFNSNPKRLYRAFALGSPSAHSSHMHVNPSRAQYSLAVSNKAVATPCRCFGGSTARYLMHSLRFFHWRSQSMTPITFFSSSRHTTFHALAVAQGRRPCLQASSSTCFETPSTLLQARIKTARASRKLLVVMGATFIKRFFFVDQPKQTLYFPSQQHCASAQCCCER